ncbi:uracil phosphoribosyltransferase, partial [Streptomyces niveus]
YYCKLPSDLHERDVVVVDPMLATGNSAVAAVDRIKEYAPRSIKFVCLLTCPEGVAAMQQAHPEVYLAGSLLASYAADALAVATPTGSTAYSFAAGGPVLSPHMDAVVFTPIAPHMTFNRTVVAAPDEPVALRVLPHSGQAAVSIDGQLSGVLDPGDWIGVFRARNRVRLIRLHPTDFYGRLRNRFRLADAPATSPDGEAAPFFRPDTPIPPDLAHMRLPPPSAAR